MAADVCATAEIDSEIGGFADTTLCYEILDKVGICDGSHDQQADALRAWLGGHKPSPALRADLRAAGFGYLLTH